MDWLIRGVIVGLRLAVAAYLIRREGPRRGR